MIRVQDNVKYLKAALIGTALMFGLMILGSAVSPGATFAAASCPVTVRSHGSTTVFPIVQAAEGPFEATRPGTDYQPTSIGSGNGINELLAHNNDMAPSSRELNAGTEQTNLYQFLIARDGFVMAVKNDANMSSVTNITDAQVKSIYEGTITDWNQLPGWTGGSHPMVPRARITGSGSYSEFLQHFAITSSLEASTITATGLPRLTESSDMADAAAANDYQIVYTSLAFIDTAGLKALTLDSVAPSQTTVGNGTYPNSGRRDLYLILPKPSFVNPIDDSPTVLAYDVLNYMDTAAGQAIVNSVGDVPVPAVSQRVPDWDVNLNGSTSLSDLGAITAKWGQSSTCDGWIRADVNNNHSVGLTDIGGVTSKWGNPGFVPPS